MFREEKTPAVMQNKRVSRRGFMGKTAAAFAASTFATRGVMASSQTQAKTKGNTPSDTINMGLIGCGLRGGSVASRFAKLPNCQVTAVCDVDMRKAKRAQKKFGGEKVQACQDLRKLLDNKNVDAVIVTTPTHWHVLATILACQAGKDVYVEKSLGRSIGEGRAAVKAARKYDRVVQIGTQQRSWEHYKKAVEIIQSGRLGEICEVKVWDDDQMYPGIGSPPDCDPPSELDWDLYCGPSRLATYNPNRAGREHYFFPDYGGSWHLDWGIHHYDIVHWAMGAKHPMSAIAMGGRVGFTKEQDNRVWPDTFSAVLQYGPCTAAKLGFLMQYSYRCANRGETCSHAKKFYGTQGSMLLSRAGFTITTERHRQGGYFGRGKWKKVIEEESFRTKGDNHQEVFLEHARNRTRPDADVETGHYSTVPGHLMSMAWQTGRRIEWDGEKEEVIGDAEANEMVTKKYRKPWSLEI